MATPRATTKAAPADSTTPDTTSSPAPQPAAVVRVDNTFGVVTGHRDGGVDQNGNPTPELWQVTDLASGAVRTVDVEPAPVTVDPF